MKTRIQNAKIVLPSETVETAIVIENGKIADISPATTLVVDEEIDANGKTLIPGVIDDQVHFREPGLTHKEDIFHGSKACAKGGITTFLEMPNTNPTTTNQAELDRKIEIATKTSFVNFGFYVGATPQNLDVLKSAQRTPGIKIFIGSSTGNLLVSDINDLRTIFAETTLPITAHCEDEATVQQNARRFEGSTDIRDHSRVRDHAAALKATQMAVGLSNEFEHPFHVLHVSTGAEADFLAQNPSPFVTAEVCLHHLFFNVGDYDRLGSRVKMNPSIKNPEDNQRLWQALLNNEIRVIATDHSPHTLEEKSEPYPACPSGLPAVENSLALMLNQINLGHCTIEQVVQWMCSNPADVWNIKNKGRIEIGYDADLCLVDMERTHQILDENQVAKCGWSPWHQVSLQGKPIRTWVQGVEVYRDDHANESFSQLSPGKLAEFGTATH
ncbi:MAG: dihydroorotase [Planctomycetota bacterium]|nr:dihydroorotase [Planctomycetota bacterium]